MITQTPENVIETAKTLLKENEVATKSIQISDEYLQEGQWLHIVVAPTKPGTSTYDFMDDIEYIERQLREQFGEKILIVPAKP